MVVLGTETEYGIALAGARPGEGPTPMELSNLVVRGYRDAVADASVGFDYSGESPLDDQWGFSLAREDAHPDLRTDEMVMANRMLTNGARLYVDHAHPEYSGPEVTSWLEAVRYDRAGDVVVRRAVEQVRAETGLELRLFKNNTDGKGQSYGTHENHLLPRELPFDDVVRGFTPYLVSRGVICGAGRVGRGRRGEEAGYQLTQRADFFEREVGIETTMRRPLVNTRDEPHAERSRYRRLHVITGDASLAQVGGWLKVGTASVVLAMIASGWQPALRPADPVRAVRDLSHGVDGDTGRLTGVVLLDDGRTATALDLQEHYAEAAAAFLAEHPLCGDEDADLLDCWTDTLGLLRTDPMACADRLDWVAKLRVLQALRARDGVAWDDARLAATDLQYAEVDPARGLALRLERSGALMELLDAAELDAATTAPPTTTRAWLRGELLRRCGPDVVVVGWDTLVVRDSRGRHVTLRLDEPLDGSERGLGARLAGAETTDALLARLGDLTA